MWLSHLNCIYRKHGFERYSKGLRSWKQKDILQYNANHTSSLILQFVNASLFHSYSC